MKSKDRIILQKISGYICDVMKYVDGYTFEQFMADKKTISACAFTVSQMGELAKNVSLDTQEAHPHIPWKSIRGMRNRIVHDYENVDLAVLWGTLAASLPELLKQIENLLYREIQESHILSDEEEEDFER
ncbi:DUF86 domain-containing protein [Paenibacillus sp. S150]|uniref:HepT-like ribonuclease domain-containing protein n=1 Tax=Paenibacillus sp. S150 TaxID=2749826 RepID=UPI001C59512E|nr:HepT-like ribonuclease domain-containing protein [Paenibacillus sp. S150]MBW4084990.1 DUF86 domain-containing protein [Paenibacillus sp. S150]